MIRHQCVRCTVTGDTPETNEHADNCEQLGIALRVVIPGDMIVVASYELAKMAEVLLDLTGKKGVGIRIDTGIETLVVRKPEVILPEKGTTPAEEGSERAGKRGRGDETIS